MIDSHCHLDLEQYDLDRVKVVERAVLAGVNTIINPGADCIDFEKPVKIAEQFENVYAAIGVHPEGIKDITEDFWIRFSELLKHPKVVAIGEVGLEKSDYLPSLKEQTMVLRRFIETANKQNKPLIFHVRDTHEEFQKLLISMSEKVTGVMHCFTGTLEEAKFYLEHGLYISIAGMLTFPKSDELCAIVKELPLESILIETDAPFLAPQIVRGQRNEPAYVVEIAKKIAEIKGISFEEVAQTTEESAKKLFTI